MKPILSIDNISVRYEHVEALSQVSLTIEPGDFVAVIGPNGGGKSTLLKTILGLIKPYTGEITFHRDKKESLIGYVPQLSEVNRNFPITVKETVLMGRLPKNSSAFWNYKKEDYLDADKVLDQVGMLELSERQINQLSGGEFKKVLIARALLANPEILILDEPAAMVDKKSRNQIYTLLEELKGKVTIILVTHDVTDVRHLATKLYNINQTAKQLFFNKEEREKNATVPVR